LVIIFVMAPEINLNSIFLQSLFSSAPVVLRVLWPLVFVGFLIVAGKLIFLVYRRHRLSKAGMDKIDVMDGKTFESYLATLFQRMGYSVKSVGTLAGDYGADLIISKDGRSVAVQAKRHKSVIGVDAVREALGSIKMYQCNSAMVVTNSYFTKQAKKLARANSVELWDREILAGRILEIRNQSGHISSIS